MVTAKEIIRFINEPVVMNEREIISLLDEELEKGADKMDLELADACVHALEKERGGKRLERQGAKALGKFFCAAAVGKVLRIILFSPRI